MVKYEASFTNSKILTHRSRTVYSVVQGVGYKVQQVGVYKVQQVRVYKVSLFVREVGSSVYFPNKFVLIFLISHNHISFQLQLCRHVGLSMHWRWWRKNCPLKW